MKSTNIDGVQMDIRSCFMCYHSHVVAEISLCRHPKREHETIIDWGNNDHKHIKDVMFDCPLPDVCPECNEPIENKKV